MRSLPRANRPRKSWRRMSMHWSRPGLEYPRQSRPNTLPVCLKDAHEKDNSYRMSCAACCRRTSSMRSNTWPQRSSQVATLIRKRLAMNETFHFEPPEIIDQDIAWVCGVLKLQKNAFSGPDGKDARLEALKSTATLDVEACPGSGKTTLLVAKLAILARKWAEARRGVCVLSHTNVARLEIEKRLGNTTAGQHLLTYPHFVGTIHGFVNEFLAVPWLRSLGYPIRMIDNHLCEHPRRQLLTLGQFKALASYVNLKEGSDLSTRRNVVSKWRIVSPLFEV